MGEGVFSWFWAWDFGLRNNGDFLAWDLRVDIWLTGITWDFGLRISGIWFRDFLAWILG